MTEYEYQLIQEGLQNKLHISCHLTNHGEACNNGILCAMSKVHEIYLQFGTMILKSNTLSTN